MMARALLRRMPGAGRLCQRFSAVRSVLATEQDFPFGFHGDVIFRKFVTLILNSLPATSFVETGTYLGDSTGYVAVVARHLPVYSCDLNRDYHWQATQRLGGLRKISLRNTSSPGFLADLIENELLGSLPVFFLDAHWYDYWPLQDEVQIISTKLKRAVVIIDDFRVPDQPQFRYDIGGGGSPEFSGRTTTDMRQCDWDFIRGRLTRQHSYKVLFPSYKAAQAYPVQEGHPLTGFVVIFQNLEPELASLLSLQFITECFQPFDVAGTSSELRANLVAIG